MKQIDPVGPNGEAIIDYSVFDAIRAGFDRIVFVIRKEIESEFRKFITHKFEGKIKVEYVFQELDKIPEGFEVPPNRTKPWGTGHAILMADEIINEPFAAINSDDFYGLQSFKIQYDFLQSLKNNNSPQFSMIGYNLRNTLSDYGSVSRAVCKYDDEYYLKNIVEYTKIEKKGNDAEYTDESGEKKFISGDEIVSMNMWGFTPVFFDYLREGFIEFLNTSISDNKAEFIFAVVINKLCSNNTIPVKILASQEHWFGVTYPQDKENVVKNINLLIKNGIYPEKLWK